MTGLKQKFMSSDNHREVFKEIVNLAFYDGCLLSHWAVSSMCTNGHAIIEGSALRFFNCMCKNVVRDLSERDSHRNETKIKKLTGKRYGLNKFSVFILYMPVAKLSNCGNFWFPFPLSDNLVALEYFSNS